jgi:hypothetical protein
MPKFIQAQTQLGIAHETVFGTYVPPVRFFPIKSETLSHQFAHVKRRLIRGVADNLGHVIGNNHVEGDIVMELYPDVLPYFLYVSRVSIAKTGAGPFQYVTTPTHVGDSVSLTKPSMSINVFKAGESFGFRGCVVSGWEIGVEDGIPIVTVHVVGSIESDQADPTPAYLTTDVPVTTAGWSIQIPDASAILTIEDVTFSVNDNAEPQFRIGGNGAAWIKFGEREVMASCNRDFESRAEYDAWKLTTATSVTIILTQGGKSVTIKMANVTRETYEIDGASDQGSPVMASIEYTGNYDIATSKSYEVTVAGSITNIT